MSDLLDDLSGDSADVDDEEVGYTEGTDRTIWPRSYLNLRGLRIVEWFTCHEHYGRVLDADAGKHAVKCPWSNEHSDQRPATAGDTIIWDGTNQDHRVGFFCSHDHCAKRRLHHVAELWPDVRTFGAFADYQLTEDGNANRLVDRHGDKLRHSKAFGWLSYDRRRWRRGAVSEAHTLATETIVDLQSFAVSLPLDHPSRDPLLKWALKSQAAKVLKSTLSLAMHKPEMDTPAERFDADPWLFNCPNGTLNLRTGEKLDHNPEDLITKVSRMPYDPEAKSERWAKFLARITPDEQMRKYVQRAAGYSLTGDVMEKCFFMLHGPTDSGKTTLLELLGWLWGDYAATVSSDLLLVKQNGGIPNDLAKLKGARFVWMSETEEGRRLSTALVKAMTGGDTLSARFLYKEWFDFISEFKIWFATNHKPIVRETGDAAWNRIKNLPFNVTIPKKDQNKRLVIELREDASAILNWALEGLQEWRQLGGLGEPEVVTEATKAYRGEMNLLAEWMESNTEPVKGCREKASRLHQDYVKWCKDHQEVPLSHRRFGPALVEQGLVKDEVHNVAYYAPIRLRDRATDQNLKELVAEIDASLFPAVGE